MLKGGKQGVTSQTVWNKNQVEPHIGMVRQAWNGL